MKESHEAGSTDVGDVSWTVPTAGFSTATWVPGTPAHSWQAVAAGGTSIGMKGMQNAAKVLADGVEMVNEAGLDMSTPFAFWVDDVPYMIQKVTVHESH